MSAGLRSHVAVMAGLLPAMQAFGGAALAQSDMPVIPPPSQRQTPPAQTPSGRQTSIEELARQGFDVKAIERAGQTEGRFVVMMQRAGEVRTCLMRIEFQRGQQPQRASACF